MYRSIYSGLVVSQRGGCNPGTWMHEDVAIEFARWLNPLFAIWCNGVIKEILQGRTISLHSAELQSLRDENKRLLARLEAKTSDEELIKVARELIRTQKSEARRAKEESAHMRFDGMTINPPTDCIHLKALDRQGRMRSIFLHYDHTDHWFGENGFDAANVLSGFILGKAAMRDRNVLHFTTDWYSITKGNYTKSPVRFIHRCDI